MNSPVKCSRHIRNIPPERYRLESDGRKADHMARLRHSLVNLLATYADADGSKIRPSVMTMANSLSISRRTAYRLLKDIRDLKLMRDGDVTEFKGTRERALDIAAIQALGVPDTPASGVPDSPQECQIDSSGVPDSTAGVPNSVTGVPPSAEFGTQPSYQPANKPTNLTGAVGKLFYDSTM